LWTESETLHAAHLAIINATMAERYWPHGDPIGQMIHLDELKPRTTWILEAPGNDSWVEVVGVAADTPKQWVARTRVTDSVRTLHADRQ